MESEPLPPISSLKWVMRRNDPNIRELVIYTLKTGGFEAKGFSDAISFFKGLERECPSLVLLDIMLPGTDGLAILRRLKASAGTRDIPVIMLTAKDSELDKVQLPVKRAYFWRLRANPSQSGLFPGFSTN